VRSAEDGEKLGVATAFETHAILRAGSQSKYKHKRMTAKIGTKKAWKHFLAAIRFTHVPWGCGVWPAFFSIGTGVPWPDGGEMDILEYVNDDQGGMTSFHTSKQCKLDPDEVNKYGHMPDINQPANNGSNYNCLTRYCANCTALGCAPNVMPLHTGPQWANRPGVLAMERAASFTKIFYIPDGSVPQGFAEGKVNPEEWDRWVVSYYPFGSSSGCPDADNIMSPQRFIMNIAFCGDWASKVWGNSPACHDLGLSYNHTATRKKLRVSKDQCRAVDPLAEYAPEEDCCTQFIYDGEGEHHAEEYLRERAFYNITWFKVFTS